MKPLVIASLVLASTIMASESSAQIPMPNPPPDTFTVKLPKASSSLPTKPAPVDTNSLIVIRGRDSTATDTTAIPVELRIVGDTAYVTVWKNDVLRYVYLLVRQPDGSWQKTNRLSMRLYNRKP